VPTATSAVVAIAAVAAAVAVYVEQCIYKEAQSVIMTNNSRHEFPCVLYAIHSNKQESISAAVVAVVSAVVVAVVVVMAVIRVSD
jgi:hypothetical protein